MQKKAYRVLEELCGGERPECQAFITANMETLKQVLLDTLKNASSPAKRVRPQRRRHRQLGPHTGHTRQALPKACRLNYTVLKIKTFYFNFLS